MNLLQEKPSLGQPAVFTDLGSGLYFQQLIKDWNFIKFTLRNPGQVLLQIAIVQINFDPVCWECGFTNSIGATQDRCWMWHAFVSSFCWYKTKKACEKFLFELKIQYILIYRRNIKHILWKGTSSETQDKCASPDKENLQVYKNWDGTLVKTRPAFLLWLETLHTYFGHRKTLEIS